MGTLPKRHIRSHTAVALCICVLTFPVCRQIMNTYVNLLDLFGKTGLVSYYPFGTIAPPSADAWRELLSEERKETSITRAQGS